MPAQPPEDPQELLRSRIDSFRATGDTAILDETSTAAAAEVWQASHDPSSGAIAISVVHLIAWFHWCRSDAAGDRGEADRYRAVDLFRMLLGPRPELVPEPIAQHLRTESNPAELSRRAHDLVQRAGPRDDRYLLDHAIALLRRAVRETTETTVRVDSYNALSIALHNRFDWFGDPADLDSSIDAGRMAAEGAVQARMRAAALYLSNLGVSCRTRYWRSGDAADLDDAVRYGRQAVGHAGPEDDIASYHAMLGLSLRALGSHRTTLADLDEAVASLRLSVDATPLDSPDLRKRVMNLISLLQTRFTFGGDLSDLDAAVDAAASVQRKMSVSQPNRAAMTEAVSHALSSRYERTGDRANLEDAIRHARDAVAATEMETPYRADILSHLETLLRHRYARYEHSADLDEAIRAAQDAVALTAPGAPARAGYLSALGMGLRQRFALSKDVADLRQAVEVSRGAVEVAPYRLEDRAGHLANLGAALGALFQQTNAIADLDEAIGVLREAVELSPRGRPNRLGRLGNLAIARRMRWHRDHQRHDLDEVVDLVREAVTEVAEDDPNRAQPLLQLGYGLLDRFHQAGDPADLDEAIDAWRQVTDIAEAPMSTRITASRRWANVAAENRLLASSVEGYAAAIQLLPSLAWIGLHRSDRERLLANDGVNLASDGAAIALASTDPADAIRMLEQGRAVLWADTVSPEKELRRLAQRNPFLANRLVRLREKFGVLDD
jgi:hypothetical protein